MIALYLDDIHAACNQWTWLVAFKAQLGAMFKINDLGGLSQLLVMHVTKDMTACTISLDRFKNVKDILARHSMTECKMSSLQMDPGFLFGHGQLALHICPHAPLCVFGFTHPWLRSCEPHGGSPPNAKEGGAVPSRDYRPAHVVGRGDADLSL
jgi:hypothetical protein